MCETIPISLEGRKGLQIIIEQLLKDGLLKLFMSPYNTPILPVRKPNEIYRLVQDLRELSKLVQVCHLVVPNLYTLLSKIPHKHVRFSVIDLKDALYMSTSGKQQRYLPLSGRSPVLGESNSDDGPLYHRHL